MEKLQRFSIRKLSIGAVSCMIGTVTFLGYANNVQAAEKPQTVETTKAENEIQPESTQESKPNEEVKGDTQNVAVDKDVARSQAKNSAVVNTSDQHKSVSDQSKLEDSSAVASTSERNQLQTSQDSSIKVKENNLNTDKSDTPKAVIQPASLNDENNLRDPDSKDVEVKPNESSNVDTNEQKETSTVLSKQPANADTQLAATTSRVQPFMNLAVVSDNNDLTSKHETVDSTWILHYVNQADHKQELKDPTVITMQYTRTDTPQSDGTTKYGDWSYVPGSFKQTGTPITVKDSNNPVKQDNVDKNGENFDVFTITAMYPTVAGYGFYNGINGTRLHDDLVNDNRQADTMSKDFYAEYDVAKPTQETVDSQWTIHYVNSADHQQELKAPTVITMQYTRTNTPQSDGTVQYGDWSYVPGSFKQTGTLVEVNGSDNPVKEDNVNNNGKNEDVFSIIVKHPNITGYDFHNGTNGVRLSDHLLNNESNDEIQAPTMSKDGYVEYDVAKERSVAVKFVDDESFDPDSSDGKTQVGQALTLTGRDGDTVKVNVTVPDKYQLSNGQQLPTTYTFTAGSGDVTIHLVHKVVQREATINFQLVLMTFVDFGDNSYEPVVVTQARWKQLEEEAKDGDGPVSPDGVTPFTEVGTLTGHVGYDLVDEEAVSFGDDWTSLNLGSRTYQLPNGTDVVNGILDDSDDTTGEKLKEYYLNEYQMMNPNKPLDPDYVNRPWHGYLSVNATNNTQTPGSWDVIRSGLQAGLAGDESNMLAKATGDRAATAVKMANKTIDVNWLQDNLGFGARDFSEKDGRLQAQTSWKAFGVYIPYVEKTATRTIKVTTSDGKTTTVKQTATLAKQVEFGKDAHPAWTTGEWENYEVPAIPGYTASQTNVAKETVTGETEDQTVNITYTANSQTTTVIYQAEDGTPVHTTTVKGQTGQTVKVSNEVPVGWHVVNGTVPSEITFGPNGTPKTVVTIAHSHATVTPDAPKTTSDKLPDNPAKTYPGGVSHDDLNKTITRTIKVTTPDGQTKTIEQTSKLTRTADVDEVTGEVKYSDWTTGEWASYDVPNVPGYTASQSHVAQQAVTDATEDQTIEITYTANEHQISVEYVDNATGKILKTDHVSGKTGQTVSITPHVPDGWELVSDQSVSSKVTLGADGAPVTVIKVQPQERSIAVKFVDDQSDKRQVGQAITVTGRDGGTVDLNLTVPDKYQLANGQQLPTTYTFKKGSGDLTIHLVHQVVQREATVDVQLRVITTVDIDGYPVLAVTQTHWKQLDDAIKDSKDFNSDKVFPSVKVGTLTGHVNYDLVDNQVVSFNDDWTSLNLGGQTYQMPDGTEVVNGMIIDSASSWGKTLKEQYLKYYTDADPDYVNRTWHGYLSANETNEIAPNFFSDDLQAGLVGNEPNTMAKAIGDQAATAVKIANKTIDSNWLKGNFDTSEFSEQNGRLQASADLDVMGVYIPYVEKTATRTINVITPDGKTTTVKQTATLAKQVDFGKDAHPAWTIGEWTSYDAPAIPGYTASQSQVAKETVTGTTEDQTVNITYTANPQTSTVVYQTEDGTPVHTTTVNGHTGQTVEVSNEVPVGWHVVNGTVPSEITFGPDGAPKTVVTIAHSHATVTPDAPKTTDDKLPDNPDKTYPSGVSENDLSKTITRTIKVTTPDGQTKTVAQTVKLTRTADVDEVTGEVKYSDWTTGKWDKYDAPSVLGYTASQSHVAQQEVKDTTQDQTVNITYTANEHQISIEYVNNTTGQVVKTDHVSGKTGQTVSITPHIPDGWELVSGQSVPSEVTLGADGAPTTVVKVQPQERSVAVKFVDDQSDERPVGQAITVTGRDGGTVDLNLTVPDRYQLADGQQLPTTYTFKKGSGDVTIHLVHKVVQREATVDVQLRVITLVDNGVVDDGALTFAVTQTHWKQLDDAIKDSKDFNSDKVYPSVKVGTLTGHVNYDLVDNQVVSFNDDWTSLNLDGQTYQMPDGTEVVNGVSTGSVGSWGKSLKEQLLKYYPDTDPDYVNRPWHGYLSVNKTNEINPSDLTGNDLQVGLAGNEPNALAKAIGDQAATTVKTANKTIDPNWLKGNSDEFEFSERDGQLRGDAFLPVAGVYIPYVEKTATRTINVTAPDGKTKTVKQTATLAKQVDFGKDAHPAWTTGEWASYDVPTIPGYTASQSNVAKEAVTGTTKDQTVNITYTANDGTQTIVYQDEDGSEIDKQVISGKTDEKVKVTPDVPDGYVVKGEVPSEVTIKLDDTPIIVTVEHGKSHVTPDKPVNKGDLIPDTKDKHYPEGLTHNDLNKTVTREITIIDPTGKKSTTTQTVTFTRGATVDDVTGEVIYDSWSENGKHTFDKVEVPTVQGYTASGDVPSIVVTPETQSSNVDITYIANAQHMTITYVDDTTGKKLHTDNLNGVSDQDTKYTTSDTIKKYEDQHYKLVSDSTNSQDLIFDHNDNADQSYEVHFVHGSHAISDKRTITETITYTMSDGSTAPNKAEKQVEFSRVGKHDEVTKQDHWNKWQPDKQSFDAVPTPEVKGYTPDIKLVEAKTVTAGDKDITETVTYIPNKQKAKVVFIDDTTKKTLDTHDLTGVTNSHEKYSPSEEIEKFIHDNYVFVSSDYPEKGFTYDNDDNHDQVFEVHLKEVPIESDTPIVPDNNGNNGGSNGTPTDSDKPEKDNGGSDTGKSSHKTPVKRNDNKKHHGTKKTNIQKNANKTNIQKTSKTAKLNPNRSAQPKLDKVNESTNRANRMKHDALPQTGEKHSSLMAMLGLAISSLGMIGAMKSKKRKDD